MTLSAGERVSKSVFLVITTTTTTTLKGRRKDQEEEGEMETSKKPTYHRYWEERTRRPTYIRFWFIDTHRSPQVLTHFESHFFTLDFSEAAEGLIGMESL